MTAMQEPLVMGPTVDGYTYTNEPKLTQLGPHHFMIPANYFSDQMGPDFQGGVLLELVWPQLGPAPPGRGLVAVAGRHRHRRLAVADGGAGAAWRARCAGLRALAGVSGFQSARMRRRGEAASDRARACRGAPRLRKQA